MAKPPKFPADCCGVCSYCHLHQRQYKCFEAPARLDDTTGATVRGIVIDPYEPKCRVFELRKQD